MHEPRLDFLKYAINKVLEKNSWLYRYTFIEPFDVLRLNVKAVWLRLMPSPPDILIDYGTLFDDVRSQADNWLSKRLLWMSSVELVPELDTMLSARRITLIIHTWFYNPQRK